MELPREIERITKGMPCAENRTGMSDARVLIYPELVLKILPDRPEVQREMRMLRWLEGKVPAPRVAACEKSGDSVFLLMTRVPGRMACDAALLRDPDRLTDRLAEAMRLLWETNISDCPVIRDQQAELAEARLRVEKGRVNKENAEPSTFGPGGFRDPAALLCWLENNRPSPDPVLSHGDFCLPNVLFTDGGLGGFIDLGDSGVGDRWRDIALCHRSLRHNTDGTYGTAIPGFDADRLFSALGVRRDPDKLRWYLLLDELF